jgi:NTE family protein
VGGAWQVGALAAVAAALDWDPRTAEVIVGTSSGSSTAAFLGSGTGVDELVAAQRGTDSFFTRPPAGRPRIPVPLPISLRLARAGIRSRSRLLALSGLAPRGRSDTGFLAAVPERATHPATWIVAVDVETGARVAFGSPGAPTASLRGAVRASWAVPGWFPAVRIGGRRYLDGGAYSPTSADLLANHGLDEVIVIAPMASANGESVPGVAGRVERLLRTPMSHIVARETAALRAAGTKVLRVHPAEELRDLGANFMDPRRRLAALQAALRHVPVRLAAQGIPT